MLVHPVAQDLYKGIIYVFWLIVRKCVEGIFFHIPLCDPSGQLFPIHLFLPESNTITDHITQAAQQ